MKKKLEAELISIAHRILKLKNRAELDQLQQETLNLYQKLSVLKFVEDNFSDVKPTIGYAMAEQKLEDIYQVPETEEEPEPETPEQEENAVAETPEKDAAQAEKTDNDTAETVEEPTEAEEKEQPVEEPAEPETVKDEEKPEPDDENASGEGVDTDSDGKPNVSEAEKQEQQQEQQSEAPAKDVEPAKIEIHEDVKIHQPEQQPVTTEPELPEVKGLPEGEGQDRENGTGEGIDIPSGAPAVSEEEVKTTKDTTGTDALFEQKAPEKRDVVFEDFSGYAVEPEFIKKGEPSGQSPESPVPSFDDWMNWEPKKGEAAFELPKEEPKAETNNPVDDWMNWEPTKSVDIAVHAEPTIETPSAPHIEHIEHKTPEPASADDWRNWQAAKPIYEDAAPQGQAKQPEPAATPAPKEEPKPAATPKFNDGFVRALSLGLNDRIAFEKHLFGGSGEDLNRVVSQINTLNSFQEAQDFIADLVKPDYNNWNGKEEYETRFMELVEKKFS